MTPAITSLTSLEHYLIAGGVLLILSVLTSKVTDRLGVPSLLVFLLIGMIAGSEGIGKFYFDNAFYAQIVGVFALIHILFAGGLSTEMKGIRPIIRHGSVLGTIGVLLTCLLTGWFVKTVLGFSWLEGMLLGAIISSTDAAAVFTLLGGKGVSFKGKIRPLLELEAGANDPMAVLLTVGLIELMTGKRDSAWSLIPGFFQQLLIGGAIGYAAGKSVSVFLNRVKLEFEGLYPVMTMALIVLVFGVTQSIGGSGFLAVYLAGLILGNENFIHKKSLIMFHDGIAWLMQITMFLVLGLLVYPSKLLPVAGAGLVVSAFLIFVSRPLVVYLSMLGTSFNWRERTMVAWVGLRGSVPIILATYPLIAGIGKADLIFNLVFFIVLTSVLIQGTTIPFVAKLLKLDGIKKTKFRYPIEYVPTGDLKSDLVEIEIPPHSPVVGKTIIEIGLPKDAFIVLIQHKGSVVVPKGGTHLHANDTMLVLADKATFNQINKLIGAK